jgi:hypothetical protein
MHHGQKSTIEIVGERQVDPKNDIPPEGRGARFGRIFGNLPRFRPTEASLKRLGEEMTRVEQLSDGPIPAGYTYFGQFVDHDITLDQSGDPAVAPEVGEDADNIRQGRSPSLDLDSLYGAPDAGKPELFEADGIRFRLGTTTPIPGQPAPSDQVFQGGDVPRQADGPDKGKAIIGDDRNDENLIIQQLHLAFLKFHNGTVDALLRGDTGVDQTSVFAEARRLVTLHYQWIVLNDFVRRFVDPVTFKDVLGVANLAGQRFVTPRPLVFKVSATQIPPMPLEFSGAAFRMGHTMVRETYGWNKIFQPAFGFSLFFKFTHLSGDIGRRPIFGIAMDTVPSNWLADWRRMFELETVKGVPAFARTGAGAVPLNFARKLDTHLAPVLGNLPGEDGTVPGPGETVKRRNLASLNLVRGSRLGLPSGQDVADAIVAAGDPRAKAMTPAQVLQGLPAETRRVLAALEFHQKTPLWFYILKEAENVGGDTLGPVGSRIVLETFLALIRASVVSIFSGDADRPDDIAVFDPATSPLRTPGGEAITSIPHLLAFAGDVNPLGD